jgi:hypothetical protein
MIFGEDDEDGEPFATITLPQVGPVILWQLPGFEIAGLNDESSFSIEPVPRPANDAHPSERRLVWYWDAAADEVAAAPAAFNLLAAGMRFKTLPPTSSTSPTPFLLADPLTGEQGFHNHGLLSFALDNDPSPPAGAYGFFARLLSDNYDASEPFLLVFNHGVESSQMMGAGLAINAAAFLAGDYNRDDRVDAADYVVWRDTFGSTAELAADGSGNSAIDQADYDIWRANFGFVFEEHTGARASASGAVPEPGGIVIAAIGAFLALIVRGCKREMCTRFC